MDLGPKIRGRKKKSIRFDPTDLKLLRDELKGDPNFEDYAAASDSEILRLAVFLARVHVSPDVFMMTLETVQTLLNESVRLNISEVARALGGVAAMTPRWFDPRDAARGRLH